MTRPIKFRAWDEHRKQYAMRNDCDPAVIWERETAPAVFGIFANEFIVEQFSGLHDKNGREIYEGDVLRYIRHKWIESGHPESRKDLIEIANVYWHPTYCAFRADRRQTTGSRKGEVYASSFLDWDDPRAESFSVKVIGNIHENPELLK